MFPFSIGGKIKIKDKVTFSSRAIEDEIASALIFKGVRVDYLPDGGMLFRLGVSHLFGWAFLQGISSGRVCCTEHPKALHISYKLCFFHLVILVFALVGFCKWLEVKYSPIHFPSKCYLIAWIWLVGGNILLTIREFRCFLRACAAESSERVFFWRNKDQVESLSPHLPPDLPLEGGGNL
jgi:hypothetical protein